MNKSSPHTGNLRRKISWLGGPGGISPGVVAVDAAVPLAKWTMLGKDAGARWFSQRAHYLENYMHLQGDADVSNVSVEKGSR